MSLHGPTEIARLLNIARSTVQRAVRSGELPAMVDGRGWYRIDLETAQAWAAKRNTLTPVMPVTPTKGAVDGHQ